MEKLKILCFAMLAIYGSARADRERPEGWEKDDTKGRHEDPLEWEQDCSKPCGGGEKHEDTRDWTISCNNFPCDNPLSCECGESDLMFVMDNTGSITQKNFFVEKQFVLDLNRGLLTHGGEGVEESRAAVVSYDTSAYTEFGFSDGYVFDDMDELDEKIWAIEKKVGETNTSGGLKLAMNIFDTQPSDNKKVLILLTDGASNIDKDQTIPSADALREKGIGIFAIGIGDVKEEELKGIANKPSEEFVFTGDFTQMEKIIRTVMEGACCAIPSPSCTVDDVSDCSATCGGGEIVKTSTCEHYGFGGVVVKLETVTEHLSCAEDDCPINPPECESSFSDCSVTCGDGTVTETITCDYFDIHGQVTETNTTEEVTSCADHGEVIPCPPPPECEVTDGDCSVTCGGGTYEQKTTCIIKDGYLEVVDTTVETEDIACNEDPCPPPPDCTTVDGDCTVTCGGGNMEQTISCIIKDGFLNVVDTTEETESVACNEDPCPPPPDCTTSDTDCTVTCGGGNLDRTISCTMKDGFLNVIDTTEETETVACNEDPCPPPPDCTTSDTDCTVTCGGGNLDRTISCTMKDGFLNVIDTTEETETVACNEDPCPPPPDCTTSDTDCTVTCGGGNLDRTISCTMKDGFLNVIDTTEETETVACNEDPCPPPPDCTTSDTDCTVTCGGGNLDRTISCTMKDGFLNVIDTTEETESVACNEDPCPPPPDCSVTDGDCTVTCGGGNLQRTTTCISKDGYNNVLDTTTDSETVACNSDPCPPPPDCSVVDGDCTVTCAGGSMLQTTTCLIRDGFNVLMDTVTETETVSCNDDPCPPPPECEVTNGDCSVSCGGGNMDQTTTCIIKDGYNSVVDTTSDTTVAACNEIPCPPPPECDVTTGDCTQTCGGGTMLETTTCIIFDGYRVEVDTTTDTETIVCPENPCPVPPECESITEDCSVTCGGGTQDVVTSCTYFHPDGSVDRTEETGRETFDCGNDYCPTEAPPPVDFCTLGGDTYTVGQVWEQTMTCTCREDGQTVCKLPDDECDTEIRAIIVQ